MRRPLTQQYKCHKDCPKFSPVFQQIWPVQGHGGTVSKNTARYGATNLSRLALLLHRHTEGSDISTRVKGPQ